jgi:threonyl-tRNA synthetase
VTIGPVIENGFYYDFSYKRPFTPEDLAAIEKRMTRAGRQGRTRQEACCRATRPWRTFKSIGENYKAEIIEQHPGERGRGLYYRRRNRGPVPRPARAQHRQAEGTSS